VIMDLLLLSGPIVVIEFAFGHLGRETFLGQRAQPHTISSARAQFLQHLPTLSHFSTFLQRRTDLNPNSFA
jgi:hypothetical protein